MRSGLAVGVGTGVPVGSGAVVGISDGAGVAVIVGSWVGFADWVGSSWSSAGVVASGCGSPVGAGSEHATRISRAIRAVDSSFTMSVGSLFWAVSGSLFYNTPTWPQHVVPELGRAFFMFVPLPFRALS